MLKSKSFKINKKDFVFGLEWNRLLGQNRKKEIKEIVEREASKYGLSRAIKGQAGSNKDQQVGLTADKELIGSYSAAAVFADSYQNGLIFEKLPDGSIWSCLTIEGEVIPGGDVVVNESELTDKYYSILEILDSDLDNLTVICSDEIAGTLGIRASDSATFNNIVFASKSAGSSKTRITNVTGVSKLLVIGLPAALLAVGIGSSLYSEMNKKKAVSIENPVLEFTQGPTQQEIIEAARKEEISWLKDELSSQDPVKELTWMTDEVRLMPTFVGGWKLLNATLDADNPGVINFMWKRISGTPNSFQKAAGELGWIASFDLTGKTAVTSKVIKEANSREIDNVLSFIRDTDYPRLNLVSELQLGAISWDLSAIKDDNRREAVIGVEDPLVAQKKQLVMNKYELSLSGGSLHTMKGALHYTAKIKAFLIKKVEIDIDNLKWNLIGVFYEK